jgi:hypothetical protein
VISLVLLCIVRDFYSDTDWLICQSVEEGSNSHLGAFNFGCSSTPCGCFYPPVLNTPFPF